MVADVWLVPVLLHSIVLLVLFVTLGIVNGLAIYGVYYACQHVYYTVKLLIHNYVERNI